MTDEQQPASEQPAADASSAADAEQQIDDERRYSSAEAGKLLGLQQKSVLQYIRRRLIAAETVMERRGPVHYITGVEIKRFQRERKPRGNPHRKASPPPEPPPDEPTPPDTSDNTNVLS